MLKSRYSAYFSQLVFRNDGIGVRIPLAAPLGLLDVVFVPTAHLIHGYLGAGKTTFARRLERDIPAIRFSHDEWMVRLYGNDPPIEHFADFYQRIYEQVEEIWPRCLELGIDVVLDFGFWFRQGRDETRARISAIGAQTRLYRLACSEDEAWQRIEKRNADLQGSLLIVRNTFEMLKGRFEPLAPDEARIEITG